MVRSGVEGAALDRTMRSRIPRLPERFARAHRPDVSFTVADLPQWKTDPVLVDTAGNYPGSQQYCADDRPGDEDAAGKGKIWHEHAVCGGVEALADDFFAMPPFLHLSGRSYAALAADADPAQFGTVAWLSAHKQLLHVSELAEAAHRGVALDAAEDLAARLSAEELRSVVHGETPLIAADHVLIARRSGDGPASTTYGVYPVALWDRFLADTALTATSLRPGDACLAVVGAVCFDVNPEPARRRLEQATLLGAASLLLLALALIHGTLRRSRQRRREQEARLFVLQTLSHEIRTPATSLALSLEPIRRRFDDLPEEVQPAFLRLCDGVQRLQRVVNASTQYLRGELDGGPIRFEEVEVASADDLLGGILEGYDHPLEVTPIGEPTHVRLDPYWFGVCVRNLVDNAIEHGKGPIGVRLERRGEDLILTVQDAGAGPGQVLEDMARPFVRRPDSPGLGFGLAVVQRLARAMRGELRYEASPTRFSLVLPVVSK